MADPLKIQKDKKLSEPAYDKQLKALQHDLAIVQQAYFLRGHRAVIVLEGVDAAGKGGLIRRLTAAWDPRGFSVHSISAPDERERREHYLKRFWTRMPSSGSVAVFDRSWYGRVLVERVEGFATKAEWQRAYQEIEELERTLSDSNTRVIKLFLQISPDEQLERFKARLSDPGKRWKLSFEDFRNRDKSDEYDSAIREMIKKTSTKYAPWNVVACDQKHQARIEGLKIILNALSRGVDLSPPKPDPKLLRRIKKESR